MEEPSQRCTAFAVDPCSGRLALGGPSGSVEVLDSRSGSVNEFHTVEPGVVVGMAFVAEGSMLAVVSESGRVEVRHLPGCQFAGTIALHGLDPRDFRTFGTRSVSDEGTRIRVIRMFEPTTEWASALVTGAITKPLLAVARGDTYIVNCERLAVESIAEDVHGLISPDGTSLAVNSRYPSLVELLDVADLLPRKVLGERPAFSRVYDPLAWSPDGTLVASTGYQKYDYSGARERIWVVDVTSGHDVEITGPDEDADYDYAAFSPQLGILGWATRIGTVGIESHNEGSARAMVFDSPVIGVGFTADGLLCATSERRQIVAIRPDKLLSSSPRDRRNAVSELSSGDQVTR